MFGLEGQSSDGGDVNDKRQTDNWLTRKGSATQLLEGWDLQQQYWLNGQVYKMSEFYSRRFFWLIYEIFLDV